jgi:predicted RNA polymerase sigma factor
MIREAEQILAAASNARQPGRFQLEAAIQSVHAQRAVTGHTDWEAIALLYEGLIRSAPTIGAHVGYAAALAEARGAHTGLAALEAIPAEAVRTYQPYWALSAHLLRSVGQAAQARRAYARAVGLSEDAAVREFLVGQSAETGA